MQQSSTWYSASSLIVLFVGPRTSHTQIKGANDMNHQRNAAHRRALADVASVHSDSVTARVTLLDGSISGRREVDSFGSILRVRASSFDELDKLKADLNGGYMVYVIDGAKIYTGHGQGSRTIGERLEKAVRHASQVYIIFSADPRFDKVTASYVEARLINIAAHMAIPLANSVRPFGHDGLHLSADLEQLVADTLFLLTVAGFRRFDESQLTEADRPVRVPATGDLDDLLVIDPEVAKTISAGAIFQRLVCRDVQAMGCAIAGRFLILPDADYVFESKSGLSPHNLQRRMAIETMNILRALPGVTDRAKLTVGLDCKSRAIAAKILTGEHVGTDAWQVTPNPEVGASL
jgi:hypothetical protein